MHKKLILILLDNWWMINNTYDYLTCIFKYEVSNIDSNLPFVYSKHFSCSSPSWPWSWSRSRPLARSWSWSWSLTWSFRKLKIPFTWICLASKWRKYSRCYRLISPNSYQILCTLVWTLQNSCPHLHWACQIYRSFRKWWQYPFYHLVKIAEVDCTTSKEVCNKFGIRGYPTIKYFIDGEAHQYAGRRTL